MFSARASKVERQKAVWKMKCSGPAAGRMAASSICDGSSAALIVSEQVLKDHGLTPMARIHNLTVTEGEQAFCAGADLIPEGGGGPFSSDEPVDDLSDESVRDGGGRLTLSLFQSTKPLISAGDGVAVGIGATMQLAMDFRLAADTARYGFVFARRRIVPEAFRISPKAACALFAVLR